MSTSFFFSSFSAILDYHDLMAYQNAAWADERDKHRLYLDDYRFLLEDDAKAFSSVSRQGMYRQILDLFFASPWLFYTSLSLETYAYLQNLSTGKAKPLGEGDPRTNQDDFGLLDRFFFADPEKGFNVDYLPLLQKMEAEDQDKIRQSITTITFVKGLLDVYGLIETPILIERANASLVQKMDLKQLQLYCTLLPIACYYDCTKKMATRKMGAEDEKKLRALRAKYPGLPYADYPSEDVIAYANHFYLPRFEKSAKLIYGATRDALHRFSSREAPYDDENEGSPKKDAYNEVNENVAKWYLYGHNRKTVEEIEEKKKNTIEKIDEKDIGPEIFFPFKDTIVGVYNLAKEALNLAGDVATGDMPWDDMEKIKKEFYAHRGDYLNRYILSLRRPLTPYEKDTIAGLKLAIPSKFVFHSLSREGAILIDTSDGKRYLVHPLGMGFSEMLEGGVYDEIVSTVIVPFEDYLTYDSFISSSRLLIQLPDDAMLEEGRLIRSVTDFVSLA
jgi:hypothetical protein